MFCRFPGSLSTDPDVALEAAVDPLMVKGSVRNKTAFEVIKLIQAAKESASKVRCEMRVCDCIFPPSSLFCAEAGSRHDHRSTGGLFFLVVHPHPENTGLGHM